MNLLKGRYSLSVAIGAIFGALMRFYITEFVRGIWGEDFGYCGTLLVNVSGCVAIAYILTLAIENMRPIAPELRLMATTGFCGAYTTFSTYGQEAKGFLDQGNMTMLLIYGIGSAIAGIIGIQIGVLLARASQKS
jgi:fluoride exporter